MRSTARTTDPRCGASGTPGLVPAQHDQAGVVRLAGQHVAGTAVLHHQLVRHVRVRRQQVVQRGGERGAQLRLELGAVPPGEHQVVVGGAEVPGVDDPEPDPSRPGRLQGCPDHQRRLLGPLDPHHHRRVRGRLLPSRGHDHDRGVRTRRHAVGGRQGRHMPMGPALQEDHTGLRAQSDQGGHHRLVGQLGGHGDVAARALSHRPGRGLQQLGRLAPQGRLERVPGLSPLGPDRGTDRVHEVHPGATPSRLRHRGRQHRAGLAVRHADQDPRALSSRHHNSSGQGTRPRTAFRSFHCRSTGRRWTGTMCPRSLGRWALPGASGTTHSAVIASRMSTRPARRAGPMAASTPTTAATTR